jgi:ABC-type multidrug transport system fused ATPase/permease subunit
MDLLKKLIIKRSFLTLLTAGISVVSVSVSLWWNAQLSVIINAVNKAVNISGKSIFIAAATMVLSAGISYILGICSSWTLETIAHDLRMGYAKCFIRLPFEKIEDLNAGEQLSKLQNEINDVSEFLRSNLFSIIDDLIRFAATLSWLLWLNPKLTLLANIPSVLLLWYTLFSSKIIGKAAAESQQANTRMNGSADTLITVFPILRLFDATALIKKNYQTLLASWEASSIQEERKKAGLMSLSGVISRLPLLMLFLIGGAYVINGAETIGILYVFINLSGNISGVMMNMPGRFAGFRRFAANMKRLEHSVLIEKGRGSL